MRRIFWLIFFSLLLLGGCVEKSSQLSADFQADDSKVFRDSFTIRDKTIPLPPGEWKIMASGLDAKKFFEVFLIQERPGRIFNYIILAADTVELDREGGYTSWSEVKRKDIHYAVSANNEGGEKQDAWIINNGIPTFICECTDKKVLEDASSYIKSKGLIISNDMIKVAHRLTGAHPYKKRYLQAEYYYNPEADGFPPGQKATWATSDWNSVKINSDPQKVKYISRLKEEHQLIHQKIVSGFHTNS